MKIFRYIELKSNKMANNKSSKSKLKVLQKGEQKEPDLFTQKWLSEIPNRTEKNEFKEIFNSLKDSEKCNLNRDTHIFVRFQKILD